MDPWTAMSRIHKHSHIVRRHPVQNPITPNVILCQSTIHIVQIVTRRTIGTATTQPNNKTGLLRAQDVVALTV